MHLSLNGSAEQCDAKFYSSARVVVARYIRITTTYWLYIMNINKYFIIQYETWHMLRQGTAGHHKPAIYSQFIRARSRKGKHSNINGLNPSFCCAFCLRQLVIIVWYCLFQYISSYRQSSVFQKISLRCIHRPKDLFYRASRHRYEIKKTGSALLFFLPISAFVEEISLAYERILIQEIYKLLTHKAENPDFIFLCCPVLLLIDYCSFQYHDHL